MNRTKEAVTWEYNSKYPLALIDWGTAIVQMTSRNILGARTHGLLKEFLNDGGSTCPI